LLILLRIVLGIITDVPAPTLWLPDKVFGPGPDPNSFLLQP
jgi:hypothetical protein